MVHLAYGQDRITGVGQWWFVFGLGWGFWTVHTQQKA